MINKELLFLMIDTEIFFNNLLLPRGLNLSALGVGFSTKDHVSYLSLQFCLKINKPVYESLVLLHRQAASARETGYLCNLT